MCQHNLRFRDFETYPIWELDSFLPAQRISTIGDKQRGDTKFPILSLKPFERFFYWWQYLFSTYYDTVNVKN